jgi:hypothetical protein
MPIIITCAGCKAKLRIRDEFAGKSMKCPRCSNPVQVAAPEEPAVATAVAEEEPVVAAVAEEDEPVVAATAVEEGKPKSRRAHEPETMACPECGKKIPADALRCRYCKARLDEEDYEEEQQPRSKYKPCPKCGERNPQKVKWTAWGSFYGPKMFNHVRCRECGYAYNGRTGRSNAAAISIFIAIPIVLIAGILVGLFFILKSKGVFS